MTDRPGKRRHVWVDVSGGGCCPGLVIAWRRPADGGQGWEAQVAVVRQGSLLVEWVDRSLIRPVIDDGWELRPRTLADRVNGTR